MRIKDTIENEFNEFSSNYTQDMIGCVPHYEFLLSSFTRALLPHFNPKTILDLGCGNGNVTAQLLTVFPDAHYTLLDASPQMIALCKERFTPFHVNYVTSYFKDFGFSSEAYDMVTAGFSIHHCEAEEKQALFRSIYSTLPPGGLFCFTDLMIDKKKASHSSFLKGWEQFVRTNFPDSDKWEWLMEHYAEFDKPEELSLQVQWLKEAGFKKVVPSVKDSYWASIRAEK